MAVHLETRLSRLRNLTPVRESVLQCEGLLTRNKTLPTLRGDPRLTLTRGCYMSGGLYHLDEGGPRRKRDPNEPRRAKMPEGPKLGVDPDERIPWTYGHYRPHYHIFRQLWPEPDLFKRKFGAKTEVFVRKAPPVEQVIVPVRKKRSPTAILEALASTVQIQDQTVHYDMMDDPYLLPPNYMMQHLLRQSKAFGRQAAKHIAEDHPYFFDFEFFQPEPAISAFEADPPWKHGDFVSPILAHANPDFGDKDAKAEDVICERIQAGRFDLAFKAYEENLDKNEPLSTEVLTSLFEIAAIKNYSTGSNDSGYPNYQSLRPSNAQASANVTKFEDRDKIGSRPDNWNPQGVAEDLWRRIPKTDSLHCTFVRALVLHGSTQRALQHLQMMIEEEKVIDLDTFNMVLAHHNELDQWEQMSLNEETTYLRLLDIMANRGLKPNVDTFNAVLRGLRDPRVSEQRMRAENVIVEMMELGVRPNFKTLELLLRFWGKKGSGRLPTMQRVDWLIDQIEVSQLEAEEAEDCTFAGEAMFTCRNFGLVETADRINDMVLNGRLRMNKLDILQSYVKIYLDLLLRNATLEDVMRIFNTFIPNLTVLSQRDMDRFLEGLALLTPIPSRHMVKLANCVTRPESNLTLEQFEAIAGFLPQSQANESESAALATVAVSLFDYFLRHCEVSEMDISKSAIISGGLLMRSDIKALTGPTYESLILSLCYGDNIDKAKVVFCNFADMKDPVHGRPPVEGAAELARCLAESNIPDKGIVFIRILRFFFDVGAKHHLEEAVDLMLEKMPLDPESALVVAELKKELASDSSKKKRLEN